MSIEPPPLNPSEASSEDSPSTGEDFLKTEYSLLNEWAIHGEDVAHRIFNFYITLLTAVLGALLVAVQLLSSSAQTSLLIIGGACGFLLLLGVTFYDALVSQYIHNAYYHAGMLSIRAYFRRYQEPTASLLELPSVLSRVGVKGNSSLTQQLTVVTIGFPTGNPLSLIAGINGLLVGALIWCLIWGFGGIGFRPFATVVASAICTLISYAVHTRLANAMIKRNLTAIVRSLSSQNVSQSTSPQPLSDLSQQMSERPNEVKPSENVSPPTRDKDVSRSSEIPNRAA